MVCNCPFFYQCSGAVIYIGKAIIAAYIVGKMENKYLKIINIILAINNSSFVIKQSENMHIIKYKNIVFVIIEKMHEIIENIEYTLLCIIK